MYIQKVELNTHLKKFGFKNNFYIDYRMNKYQNGLIYKIVDNLSDMVYYGSTYLTLPQRIIYHKSSYSRFLENEKNERCSSFNIIMSDDYQVILVEKYPCNSKKELEDREGYYIKNNPCINTQIPGQSKSEYFKKYQKQNRLIYNQHAKKWADKNRDLIKIKNAEYKLENKEKLKKMRAIHDSEKIPCSNCSTLISRGHMTCHKKSLKCMSFKKNL